MRKVLGVVQMMPPNIPQTSKAEILSILQSSEDVERIILSYLGLGKIQVVENGSKTIKIKRISQPLFTYEFVYQLKGYLESYLNFNVQVTRWEHQRITDHTREFCLGLIRLLATKGDDAFISERSWRLILAVHNYIHPDDISKGWKSGWRKHEIEWELDAPVSSRLLQFVKDPTEENEQTLVFGQIVRQFAVLLEGSLNKGYADIGKQLGQLPELMRDTMTTNSTIIERNDGMKNNNQSLTGGQQWN